MSNQPDPKTRRTNRAQLIAFALILLVFAGPAVYRIGRYLIGLL